VARGRSRDSKPCGVAVGSVVGARASTAFDATTPYLKIAVYIFALVALVAAFCASLYIMLASRFSDDLKKAAWGTVGTVVGFAIGLLVKL
jgi:uncharacterized BrkB/YihY/UPF0761 family membrane protein